MNHINRRKMITKINTHMKFSSYLKLTNRMLNKLTVYNSSMVSEDTIKRFEKSYGLELPEDYKKYMMNYNGGLPKPNKFRIDENEPTITSTSLLTFFSLENEDKLNNIDSYLNTGLLKNNKIIPIGLDIYDGIICMSLTKNKYGYIYYSEQFHLDKSPKDFTLLTEGFNNFLNTLTY